MDPQPRTLHLEDAARLDGPSGFSLMLKPVGSRCNLGCAYCYYLDTAGMYGGHPSLMSTALLETAIRSYCEACQGPELQFIWHGGEPLLAGLDFFRQAVALERRYCGGRPVYNSIQTNGTLLTPAWAAFFRDHHFLVGLSIDGPREVHERFRRNRGGASSFDRTLAGLGLLRDAGVAFNTLTTVNRASEGRGAEVYAFLKSLGSRHMQFLPVMEFGPASGTSVSAEGFGRFMADVFDVWVREDVGTCFVQLFDAALSAWCGLPPGVCTLGRRCEGTAVIEHNGDVYLCDHCVSPQDRLGNINETPLRELMAAPAVEIFAARKSASLPVRCQRCPWLPACYGECPQHRMPATGPDAASGLNAKTGTSASGSDVRHDARACGLNVLCEGYRLFFEHAAPQLDRMRALLAAGRAPAEIMHT